MTVRTGRGGLPRTGGTMTGDLTMAAGAQILLNDGSASAPALADAAEPTKKGIAFSDTGSAGKIEFITNGAIRCVLDGDRLRGTNTAAYALITVTPTATTPSMAPNGRQDSNSGHGWAGADLPTEIAGGIEQVRYSPTGTSFTGGSTHSSFANVRSVVQSHTLAASTSSVLTLGLPAGAFVLGVGAIVTTEVATAT